MRRLLLIPLLLCGSLFGQAVFDAVGPSAAGTSGTGSLSWTHTTSGSNRAIFVGVCVADDASTITVTYNGVSLNSIGKIHSNNNTLGFAQLFGLAGDANVTVGGNTVAVTKSAGAGTTEAGSISVTGASSIGTGVTGAGSATPATVTVTSATNHLVIDVVCSGTNGTTTATGTGHSSRWSLALNSASAVGNSGSGTTTGAASVTPSWTIPTDWWGEVAVDVTSAAASVGPNVGFKGKVGFIGNVGIK